MNTKEPGKGQGREFLAAPYNPQYPIPDDRRGTGD